MFVFEILSGINMRLRKTDRAANFINDSLEKISIIIKYKYIDVIFCEKKIYKYVYSLKGI